MSDWKNFSIQKSVFLKDDVSLLDYQQYCIYKALVSKSFVFGLPTGSGKTVTSLSTYFYYKEKYPRTKLIIFTDPSAILQFNSEISKFFNYNKERILIYNNGGNYKKKRSQSYEDFLNNDDKEILLLNYVVGCIDFQMFHSMIEDYKKKDPNNKVFIIYDEATAFKSVSTQTHKVVHKFSKLVDRRLVLTATISKGKAEEIYGIFRGALINIEKTKQVFLDTYCVSIKLPGGFKKIVGYKNLNVLKSKIEPYCIILNKKDISPSLPPFTLKVVNVDMDNEQKEILKKIDEGYFTKESDESSELVSRLTAYGYVRRSMIDPNIVYADDDLIFNYKSPKTKQLLKMLEEDYVDEKLVVYCASKKYIRILQKEISNCNNPNYKKVLMITGDVSNDERELYKKNFTESSDYNIMLINNAGIQAINLQISGTIICCGFPDSGGNLLQLMGRISRIGSIHSNLSMVYLITNNSSEEDEYFILNKQLLLLKSILGDSEKNIIDHEILKKDNQFKGLSDDEFLSLSVDKILFNKYTKKRH